MQLIAAESFHHFCLSASAGSLGSDAVIVTHLFCICVSLKAIKVLRTSEFLPYVVFIEAPDFEVLKAMNRSAIESGVVTKQLTVSLRWRSSSAKIVGAPQ